ncbi:S-adenosyl-L-methionine dependent methyltransferase [Dentipellis sp. KUC8613]|nr:S-adenosyl-L-methionine dependent methyltransferase [Dentipellis sp. KUC8613]
MHPRNPYRTPPDFAALAEHYPPLQQQSASGGPTIDFNDEQAQRRLTEALLHRDFQLSVTIPDNRLCPPVGAFWQLNYILWIQDIISATASDQNASVRGFDIGTGSSAIYPILGCRLCPNWHFIGSDIDRDSLASARTNVEQNNLSDRIEVVEVSADGPILRPLAVSRVTFDFTMCNPPFYSSAEDVARSAEVKEFQPNAVCTGADIEMITEGGESHFVCRMVEESLALKDRCRWYTSMLGKLSSLTDVVSRLRSHSIDNYAITEFVQGQTRRWAVGWSFTGERLPDSLARISSPGVSSLMRPRNNLRQALPDNPPPSALTEVLSSISGLTLSSTTQPITISAQSNSWSRAARRKQAAGASGAPTPGPPLLVCRASVVQDDEGPAVVFVWARGRERLAFEGFASHVAKKMRDMVRGGA